VASVGRASGHLRRRLSGAGQRPARAGRPGNAGWGLGSAGLFRGGAYLLSAVRLHATSGWSPADRALFEAASHTVGVSLERQSHQQSLERDALTDRLVARGVAADPALLEPQWRATVEDVLAEATLDVPQTAWHPTGGRSGAHTTSFGYLLAELQHLHRSHPGASW